MKNKTYKLGLCVLGGFDDAKGNIEYVAFVEANNLYQAKQKWAKITEHLDPHWNNQNQTYWGWEVVEIKENIANAA